MDVREAAIQSAIADLDSGVHASVYDALPRHTASHAVLYVTDAQTLKPHTRAHIKQQRLTPEQEDFLAEWILDEEKLFGRPTHTCTRAMAARILRIKGDHEPLGRGWIQSFLGRNPRVRDSVVDDGDGGSSSSSREGGTEDAVAVAAAAAAAAGAETITTASPEQIRAFLELFERVRIQLNIRLQDIWDMDETDIYDWRFKYEDLESFDPCSHTREAGSTH